MRLVTFGSGGCERLGVLLHNGDVLDLACAAVEIGRPRPGFGSMISLIDGGEPLLDAARQVLAACPAEAIRSANSIQLRAPLPHPPRLRDTTMFLQHMENGLLQWARTLAAKEPNPAEALELMLASGKYTLHPVFRERVIYYNADHLSVSGPDDEIIFPATSSYADFELEWACVIGESRRGITVEDARKSIFGYTIFNDWSARDFQLRFMEANLGPAEGKDFALSNTLGPCIVTRDEIRDPYSLEMVARVNGEVWSRGSTSTMHHQFETAVAQFSRFEDLAPGEVIGSGTVATGCGFELGRKLRDGDVVELEVESIGILRNRVRTSSRDSDAAS